MAKVMFQFRKRGKPPSLEEVCGTYGLRSEDVDTEYGVVATDTRDGLYVVLVDPAAESRIRQVLAELGLASDSAVGVFSNPPVEPFGSAEGPGDSSPFSM